MLFCNCKPLLKVICIYFCNCYILKKDSCHTETKTFFLQIYWLIWFFKLFLLTIIIVNSLTKYLLWCTLIFYCYVRSVSGHNLLISPGGIVKLSGLRHALSMLSSSRHLKTVHDFPGQHFLDSLLWASPELLQQVGCKKLTIIQ